MRSSCSRAGRRASVLAAAALVSLTTACGPGDLQIGAAGTAGQTDASSVTRTDEQLSLGGGATAPGSAVPTPVPTPTTPAQVPTQAPVTGSTEPQAG